MKEFGVLSQNRLKIFFIVIIGLFAVFMFRVGYMKYIYQNNIVTFAQMDQEVKELNAPIIKELTNSFDVNLDDYSEITKEQIINSAQTDEASLSLLDIMITSCSEGCIGQPVIYIYHEKGYVFYKTENGENILHEIRKENDRWGIVKS